MARNTQPLTRWQTVRQSQLIHPDWDVATHLHYLKWEAGFTTAQVAEVAPHISRWLTENTAWDARQAAFDAAWAAR